MMIRSSMGRADLIVFDERGYPAQGRLEGRKPVGRLLRHIQEYLDTVHRPLHLGC